MNNIEKEALLQEYTTKHDNENCDCNEENMELCS